MATHKSAAKRNRQRLARTVRTRSYRTFVRGVIKAANAAIEAQSDDAAALVRRASILLDKAGSKNAFPTRRASRMKGRLAAKLHHGSKQGSKAEPVSQG